MSVMNLIEASIFNPTVFKDGGGEKILYQSIIPEKLLVLREESIRRIIHNFRPIIINESADFSTNIGIVGPSGVGKTTIAQYTGEALRLIAEKSNIRLYCDYRNCWVTRKMKTILLGVLRDQFGFFSRGLSDDETLGKLISRLRDESAHLILILDEASLLPEEEIRGFLRISEEYGSSSRISLVMISRPTEWRVISPHSRMDDIIRMKQFTYQEMCQILEFKARLAFKPDVLPVEIINMVAEIAHKRKDIRVGLEILCRAGHEADQRRLDKITIELVCRVS